MMKGPYEVRPGLTLPDGDILYPDPAIFDTTLAMLDFGDTWAGAGKVEGTPLTTGFAISAMSMISPIQTYLCHLTAMVFSLQSTTAAK